MSKRDALYQQLSGPDGVPWPDDPAERADAARDMFGARTVGAMDVIIVDADTLADGRLTETGQRSIPGESIRDEEEYFIRAFKDLQPEERAAVKALVRKTCSGFLYWLLVKLDQFPGARLDIVANLQSGDDDIGSCLINEDELRYRYYEWIDRFSDEVASKP